MYAKIDNRFLVYVVNPHRFAEKDEIRISYDMRECPGFSSYISDKVLKGEPISYHDDLQECNLYIRGFSAAEEMSRGTQNPDVILSEKIYGAIVKEIPREGRIDFAKNQANGKLQIQTSPTDWSPFRDKI